MNAYYRAGIKARQRGEHYTVNPFSRKSPRTFYQWAAGWNDEDIRLANMRYFVNDTNRMVRTCDTGVYQPAGDWRQVTLAEWDEFRAATKKVKRK